MGFRKEKPIQMKSSTSSLSNNLSVQVDLRRKVINYAVVHKSLVNLVSASTDGSMVNHRQVTCKEPSATVHGNTIIIEARLVTTAGRTVLVMTSQKGIQMYEADMSVMLYWYALGDVQRSEECSFGRGICGVGENTICVGTHEGHILVFDIPERGTNITLSQTLKNHNNPICALESDDKYLVSSDDAGNILVWRAYDGDFQHVVKIPGSGYPCTTMSLHEDLIIAGYASGHLRVFNINGGSLRCEADAHARAITSVDVAHSTGLVLSAAEDSFARVWRISDCGELEHRHTELLTDIQIQGAKFIGKDGRAFGCTGYDSSEIQFFTQD